MAGRRLIVFDILRITAITLVLISHLSLTYGYLPLFNQTGASWIYDLFFWDIGNIGVIIFICVSGAVMELNKKPIFSALDYFSYLFLRLIRLYPAYWTSLLFAMLFFMVADNHSMGYLAWQFNGFSSFIGVWSGPLNVCGWCVGLFVILYIVFPFISKATDKKPGLTIILLLIISTITTYLINTTQQSIEMARWYPLCNLFYFGLGVYIVKKGYYPGWEDRTSIISYFGELSFYVFLFHWPLLPISKNCNILTFIVLVIVVSMAAMVIDKHLQNKLWTIKSPLKKQLIKEL